MRLAFGVLGASWMLAMVGMAEKGATVLTLTSPFEPSVAAECGHCHTCSEPGVGTGHDFHEAEPFSLDGVGGHSCFGDIQCTAAVHPLCGTGSDEETTLVLFSSMDLARRGDLSAIALLKRGWGERLHLNRERNLLQLSAKCSDQYIVAQVELANPRVSTLLAEALLQ